MIDGYADATDLAVFAHRMMPEAEQRPTCCL
jgi:hypothetical protein